MRDHFFFLGVCVTPAGYGLAITTGTCVHEHIRTQHAENSAMQVSSSRKSSGASCDIRDYEGAHRTRRGARRVREGGLRKETEGERKEENGRARKVRRETRCWFNITVFPSLSLSHLLAYSLLLGTCNLIVSDLTFDAGNQPLLFVGRSRDRGANKR